MKRWSPKEDQILQKLLSEKIRLSNILDELLQKGFERTKSAIINRASMFNYSSKKTETDICFLSKGVSNIQGVQKEPEYENFRINDMKVVNANALSIDILQKYANRPIDATHIKELTEQLIEFAQKN